MKSSILYSLIKLAIKEVNKNINNKNEFRDDRILSDSYTEINTLCGKVRFKTYIPSCF